MPHESLLSDASERSPREDALQQMSAVDDEVAVILPSAPAAEAEAPAADAVDATDVPSKSVGRALSVSSVGSDQRIKVVALQMADWSAEVEVTTSSGGGGGTARMRRKHVPSPSPTRRRRASMSDVPSRERTITRELRDMRSGFGFGELSRGCDGASRAPIAALNEEPMRTVSCVPSLILSEGGVSVHADERTVSCTSGVSVAPSLVLSEGDDDAAIGDEGHPSATTATVRSDALQLPLTAVSSADRSRAKPGTVGRFAEFALEAGENSLTTALLWSNRQKHQAIAASREAAERLAAEEAAAAAIAIEEVREVEKLRAAAAKAAEEAAEEAAVEHAAKTAVEVTASSSLQADGERAVRLASDPLAAIESITRVILMPASAVVAPATRDGPHPKHTADPDEWDATEGGSGRDRGADAEAVPADKEAASELVVAAATAELSGSAAENDYTSEGSFACRGTAHATQIGSPRGAPARAFSRTDAAHPHETEATGGRRRRRASDAGFSRARVAPAGAGSDGGAEAAPHPEFSGVGRRRRASDAGLHGRGSRRTQEDTEQDGERLATRDRPDRASRRRSSCDYGGSGDGATSSCVTAVSGGGGGYGSLAGGIPSSPTETRQEPEHSFSGRRRRASCSCDVNAVLSAAGAAAVKSRQAAPTSQRSGAPGRKRYSCDAGDMRGEPRGDARGEARGAHRERRSNNAPARSEQRAARRERASHDESDEGQSPVRHAHIRDVTREVARDAVSFKHTRERSAHRDASSKSFNHRDHGGRARRHSMQGTGLRSADMRLFDMLGDDALAA